MKDLKYLVLSDIHLYHDRNKTSEIIRNLDIYFDWYSDKSPFSKVQIIFIAGDLFDRLLNFACEEGREISLWLGRLMDFCRRYRIVLRILEGTPSHDRKQSKNSETIYRLICERTNDHFDFRYIDTLHIERIESLDFTVLYVPDEWTSSTDVTFGQVETLMQEAGLEQVDIAIMHGAFAYQLPMAPKTVPKHNEAAYLSIVKNFISIGHVHKFSTFERIVAQGSFDRLAQGEEEPKGGVLVTLSQEGNTFDFIENKGAKIFKTIQLKYKDVERSLAQISKVVEKVPDNSYIRIRTTKDHPVYLAFDEIQLHFPMVTLSKITSEDEKDAYELISSAVVLDKSYTPINIHRDNIIPMLTEAIT